MLPSKYPSLQSSYMEMGSSKQPNNDNSCEELDQFAGTAETTSRHLPATNDGVNDLGSQLTSLEVQKLKTLIKYHDSKQRFQSERSLIKMVDSTDSDYPGFGESTHSWAIFADNPKKRASKLDRFAGLLIIAFQLFTYYLFSAEAVEDYQKGVVPVTTLHDNCLMYDEAPEENFSCEAESTDNFDAFVAFFMLAIFLTHDVIQSYKLISMASFDSSLFFACLAAIEVLSAFVAASIAISYNLYIGQVTDAVEVGIGLLFIRELSQRAYAGIRDGKVKQHKTFFAVVATLVGIGMLMDPLFERLFAYKNN